MFSARTDVGVYDCNIFKETTITGKYKFNVSCEYFVRYNRESILRSADLGVLYLQHFCIFYVLNISDRRVHVQHRVKLNIFQGRVKFFQESRIVIYFPKNVEYRKLLCVKLIFSCKLIDQNRPRPHGLATFGSF